MRSNNRNWIISGLLLGILMAAMDNTIVATAMGTIIGELGGMDKFTLVTSAYITTELAGMLIYGKLADIFGRKPFYLLGLGLFIGGSILCGSAHSMVELAVFRGLQGMGAGALVPLAYTIIFDVVSLSERGKMAGLFGAVFGLSSIFGPLLGAVLTEYLDWRWVFFINIPLGLVSFVLLLRFYKDGKRSLSQRLDWLGALYLIVSICSIMAFLYLMGRSYSLSSPLVSGLIAACMISIILFFYQERHTADPILSLDLFRRRLFGATQGVAFFYCAVYIPIAVYIPVYIQAVFGGTAASVGRALTPMMLASVLSSQVGAHTVHKTSYRRLMLVSCALFFSGAAALGTLDADSSYWTLVLYMIITGLGMGFSWSVLSMASNHDMEYHNRAAANSTLSFSQSMGLTLGISVFGAVQNYIMQQGMHKAFPAGILEDVQDARALLQPAIRSQLSPESLANLTGILANSITAVITYSLIFVLIALIFIILMGDARMREQEDSDSILLPDSESPLG